MESTWNFISADEMRARRLNRLAAQTNSAPQNPTPRVQPPPESPKKPTISDAPLKRGLSSPLKNPPASHRLRTLSGPQSVNRVRTANEILSSLFNAHVEFLQSLNENDWMKQPICDCEEELLAETITAILMRELYYLSQNDSTDAAAALSNNGSYSRNF